MIGERRKNDDQMTQKYTKFMILRRSSLENKLLLNFLFFIFLNTVWTVCKLDLCLLKCINMSPWLLTGCSRKIVIESELASASLHYSALIWIFLRSGNLPWHPKANCRVFAVFQELLFYKYRNIRISQNQDYRSPTMIGTHIEDRTTISIWNGFNFDCSKWAKIYS